MASSLTYQLNQQEQQSYDKLEDTEGNLPSPPHSSCEDEQTGLTSSMKHPTNQQQPTDDESKTPASVLIPQQRRDSLQSHFSTLTLQAISNSLPANYTIDHSSIQSSLHQALTTTVAAAAAASKPPATPIPIEAATCRRGRTHHHLSPPTNSVVATAAATGGLGIRHPRRPSFQANKHRVLSPPANNKSTAHSLPTTTITSQNYQCDECGKVYKHPSCLTKHRWEHSEEWELTSKLLLTKHQQVQMLEAAAILVSMDSTTQSLGVQRLDDNEEDEVDILNDEDEDDIQVDIDDDDDDMLMEMDQDPMAHEEHAFPSMVGSTPAMLPSSFTTLV